MLQSITFAMLLPSLFRTRVLKPCMTRIFDVCLLIRFKFDVFVFS